MNQDDELLACLETAAWCSFFQSLKDNGVTDERIKKLERELDRKDCFNDVSDCFTEAFR